MFFPVSTQQARFAFKGLVYQEEFKSLFRERNNALVGNAAGLFRLLPSGLARRQFSRQSRQQPRKTDRRR
jgi:hypothetical protein